MRKIFTTTFVSLDGVMQAPGSPQEDTAGGFRYGGWQLAYDWGKDADEIMRQQVEAAPFDLLLGRVTYDIWASFWPHHTDEPTFGKPFDTAKKFVVSHNRHPLPWSNSELITGDVVGELVKLKESNGPDLSVWGSGNLIQTLLMHKLIDRMVIWTFPITIGMGKKLFASGTQPVIFTAADSHITSTGVSIVTYEPKKPLEKRT
jgi:dihydrofolate reductase